MTQPVFPSFAALAKQVWYWPVIRGVIAIIFGIVAMVSPISTAYALAIVVGIFAVVDGLVEIVDGVRYRAYGGAALRITIGVLTLLFGILVLAWPDVTTKALVYLLAIWAIVVGLVQLVVGLSLRSIPGSGWGWGVFAGVVSVVFGVLVLFQPGAAVATVIWLVGAYAVLVGLLLIGLGLTVRSLGKRSAALAQQPLEG